jgi:CheY-like chemotaxis protein/putative methionine-R-sulfoxide reductase with GAF domain
MTAIRVVVADAADDDREETVARLEAAGIETRTAETVDTAAAELTGDVDCVVTAYEFPDGTGLELLSAVRSSIPDTPCILFSDVDPGEIDTAAFGDVVVEYLGKGGPGSRERLRERIDWLVTSRTQVGYPLPDDEDARLAALGQYDLDDHDIRATLDRLTELAARHFETDIAFIGLVHEHEERFVSCYGGEIDPLERESTMCSHAIVQDDVMVVEDIREDERFKHNDALERLDIRSYVGAPLRTPDESAIGSFCLTDDETRSYSDEDIEYIRLLADEAMEQLELRRRLREGDET